tara:strand:- start:377 stop:1357 length:981 start_codon:yes stop_codon:yes gene_type:complete
MAGYKEIKGFTVQTLSSDPTTPSAIGQVYYNSTSNTLKYVSEGGVTTGTWSSGGALNVKRKGINGFGTQTAAIAVAGQGGPSNTAQTLCEAYNGSSWTEVNDINTGKIYRGNCGTQTAGLVIGGSPATNDTEEWDGTSWTETANYPGTVTDPFLCGVQTLAFCIGGDIPPFTTATNIYNGSSFTSSTAINSARNAGGAAGTTTAALITGGNTNPGAVALTESWNGSSWTEVGDLNTARNLLSSSGTTNTEMLVFGGTPNLANTENWNGTTWTEINDMGTGRQETGGTTNGSTSLAAVWGGSISATSQTITEEFTAPDLGIKTISTS